MEASEGSKDEESSTFPDPIAILKEITKVVAGIKRNDGNRKLNEIAEMKQLRIFICDRNPVRSVTACQGLLSLVEDEILPPIHAISQLVSAFSDIQNYSAVTAALSVLLRWDMNTRPKPYECPFSLYPIQHPLITLLKHHKNTWPDVYRLVQNFLTHSEKSIEEEKMSLLRPLLLYVLCDPQAHPQLPAESRQKTWSLMLYFLDDLLVRQLIFQSILWLQISENSRCVETGMLLIDLCEAALRGHDGPLCLALAPVAAASIHNLVVRGADPEPCLATVIRLLNVSPSAAGCVMLLLANTLSVCPATFLAPVVKACKEIFDLKSCSQVSVYAVVSSLFPWLAFPSVLTREALQVATKFLFEIRESPLGQWSNGTNNLCSNPWFRLLRHSFENVHEAAELCRVHESWGNENEAKEWLAFVKMSSPSFIAKFAPFFCSLLICGPCSSIEENDDTVDWPSLSVLVWLASKQPAVSGRITFTLLYQLAQERKPLQQLALLRALATMGKYEENMVLILGVLKSLSSGGFYSSTLALDLYVRLWKVQPRAYRFLHELLTMPLKADNPILMWESSIAKAAAIKEICSTNPDAHGSELVPLLSQLLTQNASTEGGIASALAVQGIAYLCRAGIMDVASTWRGLAPKLKNDSRPGVIVSLCELLSVVSLLSTTTGKFEEFISDVVTTLWGWAQHSKHEVACAALRALSEFHMEQIGLKTLPATFRKNLKLPQSFCKTPGDATCDPVDVLPYIPGDCWKQVLDGLGRNEDRKDAVCDMLTSWMCHEIKLFHRGLYNQLPSKPEPTSYKHLHDSSILGTVFNIAYQTKNDSALTSLALAILAKDFPRPLPPVTWNFLEEKLKGGDQDRRHCLKILAKQCKTSPSANRIMVAELNSSNVSVDTEDCKTLLSVLHHLCQGIPPNHLGTYVNKCVQFAVSEFKTGGDASMLSVLLGHLKKALRSQDIPEANVSTLANITETLGQQIDPSHPVFGSFLECTLVLPGKNIERIISPSLWWETSPEKVLQAVHVSSAIAMAQDSDMPLAALNESIDVCSKSDHKAMECLLKAVIKVARVCRNHESNCRWILQMLGGIQSLKAKKDMEKEKKMQVLQAYCDVFMVTVIALVGHDVLAGNPELIALSSQDRLLFFPQALWTLFSTNLMWKNLTTQVIEWLYDMSISPEVPSVLAKTFRHSITPFRYHQHFKKSNVWMRILSAESH